MIMPDIHLDRSVSYSQTWKPCMGHDATIHARIAYLASAGRCIWSS